jgi:hypothetical protein
MSGTLSKRRQKAETEAAEDYAQVIRGEAWIQPDWRALNARIIDEFGHAGLLRIKRAAWKLIEGPVSS